MHLNALCSNSVVLGVLLSEARLWGSTEGPNGCESSNIDYILEHIFRDVNPI